jgi:hypothetical protein
LKLPEAYGKYFSRFPLEEDEMYAIGYNWFADVVRLAQQMSYINRDLTPEDIIEVLGRVEYYPHIFIEQDMKKLSTAIDMVLRELQEEVKVETQKPITDGFIVESCPRFSTRMNMTFGKIRDEVQINPVVVQNVIIAWQDLDQWNYNDRYVTLNDNNDMVLRTHWDYKSKEQSIERGRMTVVKAITNDLSSVEEVVATNV